MALKSYPKRIIASVLLSFCLFEGPCLSSEPSYRFNEIWAYLMKGEEIFYEERLPGHTGPITDLCYFSARVNQIGRLDQVINRPVFQRPCAKVDRIHLVISAPASRTLMYFCLFRDIQTREALIQDIVRLGGPFDGIQVDFEAIRPEERSSYLVFLSTLKKRLGSRVLSVAVPARQREMNDAFDYVGIGAIADRVIVMAYDEHWRTGTPGPIASGPWCRKVCEYARQTIPDRKLIMGLPLYGRSWQVETFAEALTYKETLDLYHRHQPRVFREEDQSPCFSFEMPARMKVYYEDLQSLGYKLDLYRQMDVHNVGFWRIGQGPVAIWQRISSP